MNVVIFDILSTGHHSEYINHLCDYILNNNKRNKYFFIVNPSFKSLFPSIFEKTKGFNNIKWIEISTEEFRKTQTGNIIQKSFSHFSVLNKYAREINPSNVILLYINLLMLPLIFSRSRYNIHGILFHQFIRTKNDGFKQKIKSFFKFIFYKICLLNDKISNIYILNDTFSVKELNRIFKSKKFKVLPDPIPKLKSIKGFNIYNYYNLDCKRKIFLHFGSLGERKGTFEILDSVQYLPKKNQKEITLLFVGKITSSSEKEIFNTKIEKARNSSAVNILYDDNFISNELMKSLFDQCFGVLITYKNPEGSSGVLGHAAASNKKVIITGKGLLKDIVERYDLGYLVDDVRPKLIADSITFMLMNYDIRDINLKAKKFVDDNSPKAFSRKIINNILNYAT